MGEFSHQNRRRPLYQRGGGVAQTTLASPPISSNVGGAEPRRTPVYLRPEQNIPEMFLASEAINFKPIVEDKDDDYHQISDESRKNNSQQNILPESSRVPSSRLDRQSDNALSRD